MKNSQTNLISDSPYTYFWKNDMETFWIVYNKNPADMSIQGFPCFCSFIIKSVSEGVKGEDDPTNQNDVLYIYPKNIPDEIKFPFIDSMVSFSFYSIMNFGCIPNSFSLSDSDISLRSFKFENGNYLVFLLKLPKFSMVSASSYALDRTLHTLSYYIQNNQLPIPNTNKDQIYSFLELHRRLICYCAFPVEFNDPFLFITSHAFLFDASPPLAIATQLDFLIVNKSENIIGTATMYNNKLSVSSIPHIISRLFPFYSNFVKMLPNHKEQEFDIISLWIPVKDIKEGARNNCLTNLNENDRIYLHLAIFAFHNTTVFILIKDNDQKVQILTKVKELLNNGIEDFSGECMKFLQIEKSDKITSVAAYWPHSGVFRSSACSPDMLLRMAVIHDEMEKNSELLEYSSNNGETQITALKIISFEAFAETESKPSFRAAIDETYSKIKQFMPNLPQELQKL